VHQQLQTQSELNLDISFSFTFSDAYAEAKLLLAVAGKQILLSITSPTSLHHQLISNSCESVYREIKNIVPLWSCRGTSFYKTYLNMIVHYLRKMVPSHWLLAYLRFISYYLGLLLPLAIRSPTRFVVTKLTNVVICKILLLRLPSRNRIQPQQ